MKKILLVEDQEFLMKALSDTLVREGFEVLKAYDGAEGLEMAKKNQPDLILLDIIMPVMDGITMLKKLREDAWGKTAKVIILTNLSSSQAMEASKGANVEEYLIKSNWKLEDVVRISKETLEI